jgi:hypothetical protein
VKYEIQAPIAPLSWLLLAIKFSGFASVIGKEVRYSLFRTRSVGYQSIPKESSRPDNISAMSPVKSLL